MKKKTAIVSVLLGVLLIGIVSAGLLDYFGKIEGSVEVSGPVFYLDNTDIMDDDSFSLKLNDDDVSGSWFQLKSDETSSKEFFSESLGVDNDFYPQDFEIVLDAKAIGLNESLNESGSVYITIFITQESGSVRKILCNTILIGIRDTKDYHAICTVDGNGMSDMASTDRLKLLLNDGSPSDAHVRVNLGTSRIEVTAQ